MQCFIQSKKCGEITKTDVLRAIGAVIFVSMYMNNMDYIL